MLLWGWRHKTSKCPSSLSRKHNAQGIKASSEVTPHRAIATKAEWCCKRPDVGTKGTQQRIHKQTHKTEVTKVSKVSKLEEQEPFNNLCWGKQIFLCKRIKWHTSLSCCRKTYSKWIKDLRVKHKTPKLLGERQETHFKAQTQAGTLWKEWGQHRKQHQEVRHGNAWRAKVSDQEEGCRQSESTEYRMEDTFVRED